MGGYPSKTTSGNIIKHIMLLKADRSPACRAVMMALDALDLNIYEVEVNMDKGEHRCPEMSMINPLQTLPVLNHAIATYLATRYRTHEASLLVPSDAGGRALLDQHLHFHSGVLYPWYKEAAYPILYKDCRTLEPQIVSDVECAYCDLEHMVARRPFLGGNWCSLGDIFIAATVSTLNILVPVDRGRFPNVFSWLYRMSKTSCYTTANKKGLNEFASRIGCGSCENFKDKEFKCPRMSTRRREEVHLMDRVTNS